MKIWTIQTAVVWEKFQQSGVLRADVAFIDPYFIAAYQWLVVQMKQQVGLPPVGVDFPVWAWYQYDGVRKPRPDLRHAAHLHRGEKGVLLECDCPENAILLSGFMLWHYVLNNSYLPSNEADDWAFEERCATLSDEDCQQQKTKSWARIFNLDWSDSRQIYASPRDDKAIQGTLWEIQLDRVKSASLFVAR